MPLSKQSAMTMPTVMEMTLRVAVEIEVVGIVVLVEGVLRLMNRRSCCRSFTEFRVLLNQTILLDGWRLLTAHNCAVMSHHWCADSADALVSVMEGRKVDGPDNAEDGCGDNAAMVQLTGFRVSRVLQK